MKATLSLFAAAALALGLACGHSKPTVQQPEVSLDAGNVEGAAEPVDAGPPPLYDRLGGKDGVAGVIEALLSDIAADKRINKLFAHTTGPKLDHLKQMLAEDVCEISGGGCTYTGKNMRDAHKGMKLEGAQFDAFLQDLGLALDEKQVSKDDQKELLDKLGAQREQIVEKKEKK